MLSASVDRALVQAAAEVVVLADHTKLGADTMFQTVPTDLITRLVTDEPPLHDERAAAELQALADQGVQITVAGAGRGRRGEAPRRGPPAPPRHAASRASAGRRRAGPEAWDRNCAARRPCPTRHVVGRAGPGGGPASAVGPGPCRGRCPRTPAPQTPEGLDWPALDSRDAGALSARPDASPSGGAPISPSGV